MFAILYRCDVVTSVAVVLFRTVGSRVAAPQYLQQDARGTRLGGRVEVLSRAALKYHSN